MILQFIKINNVFYLILVLLIVTSCKNEPKNSQQINGQEISNDFEKSGKEKLKILESGSKKTYTRNTDCKTFYNTIDFSSLCFTSEKTPKIQPQPNSGNNCQYKIILDDFGTEIYVVVNYHDFENSIYNDPEKARIIFEQTFKRKKSNKAFFTETTDVNLESEAYFGIHTSRKQKSLSIRMENVFIAIQVEAVDKTNPCLVSKDELMKFANLIIQRVKS